MRNREFLSDVRDRVHLLRTHTVIEPTDRAAIARARHRMRGAHHEDPLRMLALIDVLKDWLRHKKLADKTRTAAARKLHEEEAHLLVLRDALDVAKKDTALRRLVHDKLSRRYD